MGRLGWAAAGGLYIASSKEITATCAHSDADYYGEQCSAFRGADARYLQ